MEKGYFAITQWPKLYGILQTHLALDKKAAISQTIFSDAFLWMEFLYSN